MLGFALFCGAVLALIAGTFARSVRAHGRVETRARVMELLSRALARGRSLPVLFDCLARDLRGTDQEKMEAISKSLREGAPLSEAMTSAHSALLSEPWPQLVAAVEGDPALSQVLEDEAREESRRGRFLERLLVALVYPAILGFCVVGLHGALGWLDHSGTRDWLARPNLDSAGTLAIALAFIGGLLAWRVRGLPSWVPRPFGARTQRARILRVVAALMDRGVPLHEALARVQPLATHRKIARLVRNATQGAESGESATSALAPLGRNSAWRARIRSASSSRLTTQLRAAAQAVGIRETSLRRSWLASVQPAAVVVCGVVVLFGYTAFMRFLVSVQDTAMPW